MIYGFAGKMCSGKDTFFDYLVREGFLCEQQFSFANKVKGIAAELFNINHIVDQYGNYTVERSNLTRETLQAVGQQMRCIYLNVWVDYLLREIEDFTKDLKNINIGITDVRHPNEAKAIIDAGGKVILLIAPEKLRKERMFIRDGTRPSDYDWRKWANHPSEVGVDEILNDYFNNDNLLAINQRTNDLKKIINLLGEYFPLMNEDIKTLTRHNLIDRPVNYEAQTDKHGNVIVIRVD